MSLCDYMFLFFFDPKNGIGMLCGKFLFDFLRNYHIALQNGCTIFAFLSEMCESFNFPTLQSILSTVCHFIVATLV